MENRPTDVTEDMPPLIVTCFMLAFCFDPEDGGDFFIGNVDWLSHLKRQNC
jgi:hypothetical protein